MLETSREALKEIDENGQRETNIERVVQCVEFFPGWTYDEYAEKLKLDKHETMKRLCDAKKRNLVTHGHRVLVPGSCRRKSTWFPIWMVARMDMPLDCDYGYPTFRLDDVIYAGFNDLPLFARLDNNLGSLDKLCKDHDIRAAHVTIQTPNGFATYKRMEAGKWILQQGEQR